VGKFDGNFAVGLLLKAIYQMHELFVVCKVVLFCQVLKPVLWASKSGLVFS
jgi:hypothetical protein